VRTVAWDASSIEVVMWVAVMTFGAQLKFGMVGIDSVNASPAGRGKNWGLARVRGSVLSSCQ